MNNVSVTRSITYTGVDDCTTRIFEGLWPLYRGVSYNSYLIKDAKSAIIDTVEESFSGEFLANIKDACGSKSPDYLIVNHMEPDHSSAIKAVVALFPDIEIVGNAQTGKMIEGFYGPQAHFTEVRDGDCISLGSLTLQFYMTPMVHWPETMMTYCPEEKTLFSGDAFGTFGALRGTVTDSPQSFEEYRMEMIRYYSNIVGKYGNPVQKALAKVAGKDIARICPTHGPVWQHCLSETVNMYDRLSRYEAEPGVTVTYASMYGNTAAAAKALISELERIGEKNIAVHDLTQCNMSDVLRDLFRFDTLVIASPTYNGGLFPATESLLNAISMREVKNRRLGVIGSCSWAGVTLKKLAEFAEKADWEFLGESFEFKHGYSAEKCNTSALAASVANRSKA